MVVNVLVSVAGQALLLNKYQGVGMLKKFIFVLLIMVVAVPVAAQEITVEDDKRYGQLSYNLPLNHPITINITYKTNEGGAGLEATETVELTALRPDGDTVIYRAKTLAADLISVTGAPDMLKEALVEIGKSSIGMAYEYSADATGYPLEITDTRPVNKFIKKAGKSLKKWVKKFAKKNKLSKAERAQVMAIMDQSLVPFLSKDKEALSRLVLENPQLVFYGTGRGLYLDYYTGFDTARYLEDAEVNFHTVDEWAIDNWDAENGVAELSFTQKLNEEEFKAFLGRLRTALEAENNPNIETTIAAFRAIKMTREGSYKMDMKTGLPLSGTVTSNTFVNGKDETEIIDFTVKY